MGYIYTANGIQWFCPPHSEVFVLAWSSDAHVFGCTAVFGQVCTCQIMIMPISMWPTLSVLHLVRDTYRGQNQRE